MHGHGKPISILSVVSRSGDDGLSRHGASKPSSREKALQIGADLVRQVFGYFELDFRVGGIHLNDAGSRLGRFGQDRDFSYLVDIAHL
jgi:hypothetical protein